MRMFISWLSEVQTFIAWMSYGPTFFSCCSTTHTNMSVKVSITASLMLVLFIMNNTAEALGPGGQVPSFRTPPPRVAHFTNSTGAVVDCTAEGSPRPTISWTDRTGRAVEQISGIREVLSNGSLSFPPFSANQYNQQVHSMTYTCAATNSAGTLLALPTEVRGVVVGEYEVQVYDRLVMKGNIAVLRCAVPSYVREYVSVTSWVHDGSFNIYPSAHGDGKYLMTPGGDLHVLDIGPSDGLSRFQCRTLHRLTGHTQLSKVPARIIVTEPQGKVPPRINEQIGRVVVQTGSRVTLPCVAQGHPPPLYTWYRGSKLLTFSSSSSSSVSGGVGGTAAATAAVVGVVEAAGSRSMWNIGGTLVLDTVSLDDSGEYTCVANNTVGEARLTAHLLVTTQLSVQVTPRERQVDAGSRLELRCHVSGQPVDAVTWYKDGQLLRSGGRIRIRPRESLHIAPVDTTDAGIYQCVASFGRDRAQANAHITLGAAAPRLTYRFIEQTMQPGPAVSLKCIATGAPTPHITWSLDGFPLPHSHRYLKGQYVSAHGDVISHVNISAVHVTDGGAYTCEAENSAGKAVHSARLNVYGPPHVRPMGQLPAVAGETFLVTCPASGYPLEKIVWKKDGVKLPTIHRQHVYPNGTLIIERVTKNTDDGQYSCTALSRQGSSDTQVLSVKVMVPPRLAPLAFPGGTRAGMRAQATCLVQEGDQPLTLAWEKDGRLLDDQPNIRTSLVGSFTSIMVIDGTTAEHSGNYTCVATNPVRTTTSTARLTVSVPPAWVVEPSSASVEVGGSAALHCLAKGFPNPTIVWRKESASGEFGGVATGERGVLGLGNGTLKVGQVERRHEGRYLCEADNGVGSGLSKVVTLDVNEPPWFSVRSQRQQVLVGTSATLSCEGHGDAPLTLEWTRDGASLPALPRYEESEREVETGRVSELVVHTTHVGDSGTYVCTATNPHGSLTADFHLLVQDVPKPPVGLSVLEEGSRHLTLAWSSPVGSNAPMLSYTVKLTPQGDQLNSGQPEGPREVTVEGDQKKVRVDGLLPATTYVVSVVGENRVGRSQPSQPLRALTQEESPTGHPQNVRVLALSSTALKVTWEPPLGNLTHGTILGYYLGFKEESEGESSSYNFTTVSMDGTGATTAATLTGLRPHTGYLVVLRAFNSKGASPISPPTLGTTLEDKPSAPPGHVTCEAVTSRSLVVTWKPPPERQANGIITGYRVTYSTVSLENDRDVGGSKISKNLRATLGNLLPWTNYSVTVAASTRAGEGLASQPFVCTTKQDVPDAPLLLKAIASGPRAAVVSWSAPDRPNGHILRYRIYWLTVGGRGTPHSRDVGYHANHVTLHDLPHNTHQIWVSAWTRVGEGPSSVVVTVKPSRTVSAGVWSVGGNVTAAWKEDVSLPCGAVGVPEPRLTWTHKDVPVLTNHGRFTVQPDGTLTLADVQRRDSGAYTCTASNRHGTDSVVYNLTVIVPPSAPSLHVIETTSSSVRVQWTIEDLGGASLQRTTLHYRSTGGEWVTERVDVGHRAHTATGLKCGTPHHFYLTATNRIGTSAASKTVGAKTKGRAPEMPPQFQFVTTNSSQATLYLAQWGDGGCPITHFSVFYRRERNTKWTTVGTEIPPSRTFAVSGLSPGSRYHLRVTAYNSAGATPALYRIVTPGEGGKRGYTLSSSRGVWGGTPSTTPVWQDPRVLVPAALSSLALLLTIATVCLCIRRRSSSSSPSKEVPEGVGHPKGVDEKSALHVQEGIYTTIRRPPMAPPRTTPERRDTADADYSEEELYPYATATTCQPQSRGSPPPPAPPSPDVNPKARSQKVFTAVVYQSASLHDVDSPNTNGYKSRLRRPYPYENSEADAYDSQLHPSAGGRKTDLVPHSRRSRHVRNSSPAKFGSPEPRPLKYHHSYHQQTLRHLRQSNGLCPP